MQLRTRLAAWALLATVPVSAGAVGTLADVTIRDAAHGRAIPIYQHDGRYYVAGETGCEYRVTLRNQTGEEILAVVSVDGVNAVSGETAAWSQTGYVLRAHQRYDVAGWRKSLERVAAFFFTSHSGAYAARTGRPDQVGVIGAAIFARKSQPVAVAPDAETVQEAVANGKAAAGAADSRAAPPVHRERELGTGHGRLRVAPVTYAAFERRTAEPQEVITIYYDTYRNLVAQGVIAGRRTAWPTPFPGQFVPDPR